MKLTFFAFVIWTFIGVVFSYGYGRELLKRKLNTIEKDKQAECVVNMVKKYFSFGKTKVRMGDTIFMKTSSSNVFIQKTMFKYLHNIQKFTLIAKNKDAIKKKASEDEDEIQAYIILIKYPLDIIQDIANMKKLPGWNPKGIFFTILEENSIDEQSIVRIFNELRKHRVFNAFVITTNDLLNSVKSFTWLPYNSGVCGVKCESLYELDYCTDEKIKQINPYMVKIPTNLNKCPIKAAAIISEPYVLPPEYENGTEIFKKGIEIKLLKVLAELSNATLDIKPFGTYTSGKDMDELGLYMDNEEYDVILGNLFPGFFLEVQSKVEALRYDFQERITWCVPKAEPLGYLINLVYIFRFEAWIVIVLMTIVISALIVYFDYRNGNFLKINFFLNFFIVFAMLAGCIARIDPKELSFRMIMSGWLMSAIITNVIVQSSSQSSLIQPRLQKQINTVQDVVSSLKIGGHSLHVNSFDIRIKEEMEFRCKYLTCAPITPCIERVTEEGDFGVLVPLRYIDYYIHREKKKNLPGMYCLRRNVLRTYNPSLMIWRYYPFREQLQLILKRIFESGLVFKWSSDVLPRYPPAKRVGGYKVLKIKHLIGVFNMLFFFWGLSTVVFMMEVVTERHRMKHICMPYFGACAFPNKRVKKMEKELLQNSKLV